MQSIAARLILILVANILAKLSTSTSSTTSSTSQLGIGIPSFVVEEEKYLRVIYIVLDLIVLAAALFPTRKWMASRMNVIASYSCHLFVSHIILHNTPINEYERGPAFVIIKVLVLFGFLVICLNEHARWIIGSIGIGYISAYYLVLLFSIQSYNICMIIGVVFITIMAVIGKLNKSIFELILRTVVVPYLFMVMCNLLFEEPFTVLHGADSGNSTAMMSKGLIIIGLALIFFYMIVIVKKNDGKETEVSV